MAMTMYDTIIPTYAQILGGMAETLDCGLAHCTEHGLDPDALAQARLAPDMQPLSFQVFSAVYHSVGSIDTLQRGAFLPPSRDPIPTYGALQRMTADALSRLETITPEDINDHLEGEVVFASHGFKLVFTRENFIHTFSLPNFYFHVSTAYDILRMSGVKLKKLNFLGNMRVISREGI